MELAGRGRRAAASGPASGNSPPKPATRYYAARQVARLLGVEPHVLRYWETKFDIRPERNSAGRRIYNQDQIEKLKRIKFLRYQEKLTIQGARRKIANLARAAEGARETQDPKAALLWLRQELTAIRDLLVEE